MNINLTRKNGFTLIELLVVISIIGLLSSVVLSSLGSARSRASDNAVKAAMKQFAGQAQNYLVVNQGFGTGSGGGTDISGTTCNTGVFGDTRMTEIKNNIAANAVSGATITCTTGGSGSLWAISVSALKGGGAWCVDNSSAFRATAPAANGLCP
jgi:prepilin-type N-terminal cleavage/methylation domain-containing protein